VQRRDGGKPISHADGETTQPGHFLARTTFPCETTTAWLCFFFPGNAALRQYIAMGQIRTCVFSASSVEEEGF
jgi:hypothetical protein